MPSHSDASVATRRQVRHHRRRRRRAIVGGLVAALLAIAALLVTTDTVRLPGQAAPRFADASSSGASEEFVVGDTPEIADAPRALSPDDPLRLWVGGDSLAGALGPAIGTLGSDSGVVRTWYDSHTSSGLVDKGIVDWETEAAEQMLEVNPEAVVFVMGTNDFNFVTDDGSWRADYARTTGVIMNVLSGDGARPVYWIGAPVLGEDDMSERVTEVNSVFVEEAERRPDVAYIDAFDLFSVNGAFAGDFENRDGEVVTMRDLDGVHFTGEGARFLAQAVFDLLNEAFDIDSQAVPGATQPVETSGTPPRYENPGSGATTTAPSGSSTPVTSPPVTAPPVTAPPTTFAPVPTEPPTTSPATTSPPTTAPATTAPADPPDGGEEGGAQGGE